MDRDARGVDVHEILLRRLEICREVGLASADFGRVHENLHDVSVLFELLPHNSVRRDKRRDDIDSLGIKFCRELLPRADVARPASLGEIPVARYFPEELTVEVNNGTAGFSKDGLEGE